MKIQSLHQYNEYCEKAIANPETFWADIAHHFTWKRQWDQVISGDFGNGHAKWFEGGRLNITENCLDRHLPEHANDVAIIWEPNEPNQPNRTLTYSALYDQVCQCANALKSLGIEKGDRVILYMPMLPELSIAVLACARIGAVHSVVFAGFSAQALADRINDASAKLIITADFNHRGIKTIPVKALVDKALELGCPTIQHVLVYRNSEHEVAFNTSVDIWWQDLVPIQLTDCPAETMESEDLLFILYTSGSTGQPKGVVHTCGGYMVYAAYSFSNVFQYEPGDIYWCSADVGWITGHTYIIYGPLLCRATSLMFEGVPTYPDAGRFWAVCEKYKVNQFYTAPTAIRALMAHGDDYPSQYNLSSLKMLGTVGEPINEEAWQWYYHQVGKGQIPIADTWFQTETGGILITSLPNIHAQKATYAGQPLPGIQTCLLNSDGEEIIENNQEGILCIKYPWPSMIRTTYGDHKRCQQTYFSAFPNNYFTGDSAKRDNEGRYRIIGRVDDVMNVSGHRIGTAEVENAINEHPLVVESAVVGYPHVIKGQAIYAYIIVHPNNLTDTTLLQEIHEKVTTFIGSIAKPEKILVVDGLPKTRSGKIMRRILRKIAAGDTKNLGDTSTLLNPEIVTGIIAKSMTFHDK